jgi:hypothetical protein
MLTPCGFTRRNIPEDTILHKTETVKGITLKIVIVRHVAHKAVELLIYDVQQDANILVEALCYKLESHGFKT